MSGAVQKIEVKAQLSVDDAGAITGVAWPFGSADRVGDIIERGAFTKALPPLPMLDSHDQKSTVGVWDEITETAEGLMVKGRLLIGDVARAAEVRALIREGALRGLSIGFASRKSLPRKGGGRTISELELLEISVVAVPAHPGARIVPENMAAITVGSSDVRYAHLQEYGTTFHPPHAFFWPAFRLHRDTSLKAIKRAIAKAIKEAK